jgi:hypothetical protein
MRRLMLVGSVATILGLGLFTWLWSGPCRPTGDCPEDRCTLIGVTPYECCVWDHGCWINPWEPDNQEWCEVVGTYICRPHMTRCYKTETAWECGPCCEDAGRVQPLPVLPAPIGP